MLVPEYVQHIVALSLSAHPMHSSLHLYRSLCMKSFQFSNDKVNLCAFTEWGEITSSIYWEICAMKWCTKESGTQGSSTRVHRPVTFV